MSAADRAHAAYVAAYGEPPALLARAPGRVNLIGEHTDYNDGFVLPIAIDRDTVVAAGMADDGHMAIVAADFGAASDRFAVTPPIARSPDDWPNYTRGVAQGLLDAGIAVPGARLAIASDVPLGSGLSSSAALELASAHALLGLARKTLDASRLATIAQTAEHRYAGCACGIMDQLISARGAADHALLIDCRSFDCRAVPMPADLAIIVVHSGIRHANNDGAYNSRRAECERAARHFGVAALRDVSLETLAAGSGGLDDSALARARHVISENARTLAAADALAAGDLAALGRLMAASHASMRDDFAITVPAIDQLQTIMHDAAAGEGGARMTGGGFGGCVIAAVPSARVETVEAAVLRDYRAPDGAAPAIFTCRASDGAGLVPTYSFYSRSS